MELGNNTHTSQEPVPHRWQQLNGVDFLQRRWEGELVVYNTGSGDTHLLETLSAEIFIHLQEQPAGLPQIVEHIADTFLYEVDEELKTHISDMLVQLQKLRLIESETCATC